MRSVGTEMNNHRSFFISGAQFFRDMMIRATLGKKSDSQQTLITATFAATGSRPTSMIQKSIIVQKAARKPLSNWIWQKKKKRRNHLQRLGFNMVGLGGLEPQTSSMSTNF